LKSRFLTFFLKIPYELFSSQLLPHSNHIVEKYWDARENGLMAKNSDICYNNNNIFPLIVFFLKLNIGQPS
jgi:hypothetical protein